MWTGDDGGGNAKEIKLKPPFAGAEERFVREFARHEGRGLAGKGDDVARNVVTRAGTRATGAEKVQRRNRIRTRPEPRQPKGRAGKGKDRRREERKSAAV